MRPPRRWLPSLFLPAVLALSGCEPEYSSFEELPKVESEYFLEELEYRADDYGSYGQDALDEENWTQAIRYLAQAIAIYEHLAEQDPEWEFEYYRDELIWMYESIASAWLGRDGFQVARASYERHLATHDALIEKGERPGERLGGAADAYEEAGSAAGDHGERELEKTWLARANELREQLLAAHPDDPDVKEAQFGVLKKLGTASLDGRKLAEAERYFERARVIGEELRRENDDEISWTASLATIYEKLGEVQEELGNLDVAISWHGKARGLHEEIWTANPEAPYWAGRKLANLVKIGALLSRAEKYDEAIEELERALRLKRELRDSDHFSYPRWRSDLALAHFWQGVTLAKRGWGTLPAAKASFESGLEILKPLEAADQLPEGREHWPETFQERIDATERLRAAKAKYRQNDPETWFALAAEILSPDQPSVGERMTDEARSLVARIPSGAKSYPQALLLRGRFATSDGDVKQAIAWNLEAAKDLRKRLEGGPNEDLAKDLWTALTRAGAGHRRLDEFDEAEARLQESLDLAVSEDLGPSERSLSLGTLAILYHERGDYPNSVEHQRQAIEAKVENVGVDPDDPKHRDSLAGSYGGLAWNAVFAKDFATAIHAGQAGLKLRYENWIAGKLAHAYLLSGDYERAEEIYLRHRGEILDPGDENRAWEDMIGTDFQELREAGIDHPDMARIEQLLEIKTDSSAR